MEGTIAVTIPIFLCVILPISIVYIIHWAGVNRNRERTRVLLKAIENDHCPDPDALARAMQDPRKSPREVLYLRLLRGCIFSLIGIMIIIGEIISVACGTDIGSDSVTIPSLFAFISLAVGASYLIVYFVSRKDVDVVKDDK